MRYSLMLQIVTVITVTLISSAALFAWMQNRPPETTDSKESKSLDTSIPK
jgi:flagellar basal body-associated protein FliL